MDLIKKLTSKKKKKKSKKDAPPNEDPSQPKLHEPNPNPGKPKGILKNKNDAEKFTNTEAYPASDDIDESLRNAQKNSSLNQSLYGTPEVSPQNEEAKSNANDKDAKDLKWDEQNLEKNEREKVPRMKIDEPPTPYEQLPPELQHDFDPHCDVEEVILDENPMDMSLEDDDHDIESMNEDVHKHKTLDQKQQALLLADDEYRQKMVTDAMNRRQPQNDSNTSNTPKKVVSSAWEMDDDSTPRINTQAAPIEDEEDSAKKEKFRKKRKQHYNEFHAIRAWRSKKTDDEDLK